MKSFFKSVFILALILGATLQLSAQIPNLISYQGILTNDMGQVFPDGDYSLEIQLFAQNSGGVALWSETHTTPVSNGFFQLTLGSITPFSLPFDQQYFVEVSVEGNALSPRTALTASPYALNSQSTIGFKPNALDAKGGAFENVVYIDSNAYIGFGTTTPTTPFHFVTPNQNLANLFIEPGIWQGFGDETRITLGDFNHTISAIYGGGMQFRDVDQFRFIGAPIIFESNARVDGRLGIGGDAEWPFQVFGDFGKTSIYGGFGGFRNTALLAAFEALQNKGAQVRFSGTEQNGTYVDIGTDSTGAFIVEQADAEMMRVDQAGRVELTGSRDIQKLYVNGGIRIADDASIYGIDGLLGFNDLRLFGNPPQQGEPEDMYIGPNGRVSIGTATDGLVLGAQFQVNGTFGQAVMVQDNEIKLTQFGGTNFSIINDGRFKIRNTSDAPDAGTAGEDILSLSSTGELTVGPAVNFFSKFSAADDYRGFYVPQWTGFSGDSIVVAAVFEGNGQTRPRVRFTKKEQASNFYDIGFNGNEDFVIASSGGGLFTMAQAGNVGLGVAVPNERLEVNGNILATGTITENSDRRFKKNFKTIDQALTKVNQLNGYYYDWNTTDFPNKAFTDDRQIGFIAQEIETLFPEMVSTDKDGYKSVNYGRMTPVLLEAIKEQQAEIDQLKAAKAALEAKLSNMESSILQRLAALENKEAEAIADQKVAGQQ